MPQGRRPLAQSVCEEAPRGGDLAGLGVFTCRSRGRSSADAVGASLVAADPPQRRGPELVAGVVRQLRAGLDLRSRSGADQGTPTRAGTPQRPLRPQSRTAPGLLGSRSRHAAPNPGRRGYSKAQPAECSVGTSPSSASADRQGRFPTLARRPCADIAARPFGGEALDEPSAEEPCAAEHSDRGHGIRSDMLRQIEAANSTMRARGTVAWQRKLARHAGHRRLAVASTRRLPRATAVPHPRRCVALPVVNWRDRYRFLLALRPSACRPLSTSRQRLGRTLATRATAVAPWQRELARPLRQLPSSRRGSRSTGYRAAPSR
jgi:hypothetical protein